MLYAIRPLNYSARCISAVLMTVHPPSANNSGVCLSVPTAKSDTIDRSFRLCDFKDDPQPLGGLIRSTDFKTLIGKFVIDAFSQFL